MADVKDRHIAISDQDLKDRVCIDGKKIVSRVTNPIGDRDDVAHNFCSYNSKNFESAFPKDVARQQEFLQKAVVFAETAGPNIAIGKLPPFSREDMREYES